MSIQIIFLVHCKSIAQRNATHTFSTFSAIARLCGKTGGLGQTDLAELLHLLVCVRVELLRNVLHPEQSSSVLRAWLLHPVHRQPRVWDRSVTEGLHLLIQATQWTSQRQSAVRNQWMRRTLKPITWLTEKDIESSILKKNPAWIPGWLQCWTSYSGLKQTWAGVADLHMLVTRAIQQPACKTYGSPAMLGFSAGLFLKQWINEETFAVKRSRALSQ